MTAKKQPETKAPKRRLTVTMKMEVHIDSGLSQKKLLDLHTSDLLAMEDVNGLDEPTKDNFCVMVSEAHDALRKALRSLLDIIGHSQGEGIP